MQTDDVQKIGYLNSDFRMFHLKENTNRVFDYHYHDFNKILIFISGDVTYSIEGRNYKLVPYDIVLVKAGEVHRPVINSGSVYERIIIYTSPQFLSAYHSDDYNLAYCFETAASERSNVLRMTALQNSRLYQCLRELEQSFEEQDYAMELNHKVLFLQFLILLNRAVIHQSLTYLSDTFSNDKIQEIMNYINNKLTSKLSIESISTQFYISRYYLMHSFKSETGYSIGSYISMKRLLLSRELITNGISVTDACYQSGFQNYSTFSRAFHNQFGINPRDYRNQIDRNR